MDVFAWTYKDMAGVDPAESIHRLGLRQTQSLSKKPKGFAPKKNKIMNYEVDRLLASGMIREVQHLD